MSSPAAAPLVTVIPTMLYRDAPAAIDWLCTVVGFEKRVVYAGENGAVGHAELTFGNGMIMLGTAKDEGFGKLVTTPAGLNGATTQAPYIIVGDVDALYERVVTSGAEIVRDLDNTTYGSREFACRDLEGHIWVFGTYNPWAPPAR